MKAGGTRGAACARPTTGRAIEWAALLACVALSLWVQRRSLGAFFSLDDLIALERARGLVPPPPMAWWRWISGPAYFGAARRLFGADPFPYHALNWVLHGVNVALLFGLVRRWGGSVLAAATAAAVFGTSRLFGVVLDQAVGVEVQLSLGFSLAAFRIVAPSPPRALLAAALFAAALLSKETVVLLPLVLLLPVVPTWSARERAVATGALGLVSLVATVALWLGGAGSETFGGQAYARAYGANLFHTLMNYAAWIVDVRNPTPDLGGASAEAWRSGVGVVGLGVAAAVIGWRHSARAAAGMLWWLLALGPVLPLVHHAYQQYLYPALPGLALTAGEAWEGLLRWIRGRVESIAASRAAPGRVTARLVWGRLAGAELTVIALLVLALASDAMLARRWTERVSGLEMLRDPHLDRSEFVRSVSASLAPSLEGRGHVRLAFFVPGESRQRVSVVTGQVLPQGGSVSHDLLPTVLDQGRALKALHPGVDSVVFLNRWTPAYDGFDIVINSPDGHCIDLGQGLEAHRRLVDALWQGGFGTVALDHLRTLVSVYPEDTSLASAYRQVEAQLEAGATAR